MKRKIKFISEHEINALHHPVTLKRPKAAPRIVKPPPRFKEKLDFGPALLTDEPLRSAWKYRNNCVRVSFYASRDGALPRYPVDTTFVNSKHAGIALLGSDASWHHIHRSIKQSRCINGYFLEYTQSLFMQSN